MANEENEFAGIDEQIIAQQSAINSLIERIQSIPSKIQIAQKSIVFADSVEETPQLLSMVVALKHELEYNKFQLLQEQAQLERLRGQQILAEADKVRAQYENALDLLPQVSADYEAAKTSLENLNSQLTLLTNNLAGKERRAQEYFENAQQIEEQTVQF